MNLRYRLILCLIILIMLWKLYNYITIHIEEEKLLNAESTLAQNHEEQNEVVKVSVYYETLCPDSRNFIIKHLLPTYKKLDSYILLDLVPYGKAETFVGTDGSITFECQHGSLECLGNKVHACAIDGILDQNTQLNYVACMIDNNIQPINIAEKCGYNYDVDFRPFIECTNDKKGSELLKNFGERTKAVAPTISFIPTIQFNDSLKVPLSHVLKDFEKELCKMYVKLPPQCKI